VIQKLRNLNISEAIFYLVCFALPINLGKHFEVLWSYFNGLLIDYYIPTLFITDLLIIILIISWFLTGFKAKRTIPFYSFYIVALLIFTLIISLLFNENVQPGFYQLGRILLYLGFFAYGYCNFDFKTDTPRLIYVLSFSAFFVSVLALGQWFKQGSVFNNYLFFGEQPYSFSTWGIIHDDFLGYTKIPAYSLFRHPNSLAAYLVIVLLLQGYLLVNGKGRGVLFLLAIINIFSLVTTLSYFSWAVLSWSSLCFLISYVRPRLKVFLIITTVVLVTLLHVFPIFDLTSQNRIYNISIQRRSYMLKESLSIFERSPLYGVGFFNNLRHMDSYSQGIGDFRFIQPVHSVFALILSELGIVAFTLLIMLLAWLGVRVRSSLQVSLYVAILLFMSFDHYFITSQQLYLLILLTLVILITYNFSNEV